MTHQDRHFNAEKVFAGLFVLTALEVLWGYTFGVWLVPEGESANKLLLWGGLILFAFFKGLLIAAYFMHLKFEGWIVKALILPTPFLILAILGYVVPDVSDEEAPLVHPIGSYQHVEEGRVIEDMEQNQGPALARAAGRSDRGRALGRSTPWHASSSGWRSSSRRAATRAARAPATRSRWPRTRPTPSARCRISRSPRRAGRG
jgi:hypothetical protein